MRRKYKVEVNGVDVGYYLTNWKPYVKWVKEDAELYVRKAIPRWKAEFRYFDALLRQGHSLMDIQNMRQDEYAELRKKLPFITRADNKMKNEKAEKELRECQQQT